MQVIAIRADGNPRTRVPARACQAPDSRTVGDES